MESESTKKAYVWIVRQCGVAMNWRLTWVTSNERMKFFFLKKIKWKKSRVDWAKMVLEFGLQSSCHSVVLLFIFVEKRMNERNIKHLKHTNTGVVMCTEVCVYVCVKESARAPKKSIASNSPKTIIAFPKKGNAVEVLPLIFNFSGFFNRFFCCSPLSMCNVQFLLHL